MAYIFKQKLQISDLVDISHEKKKILLYQPEEYLGVLYGHYLRLHNFDVKHCPLLAELKSHTENFLPDVLIFNIQLDGVNRQLSLLRSFKKEFPSVFVVTLGMDIGAEALKQLLDMGVSSHINRKHSRPQDLAIITKSILNN